MPKKKLQTVTSPAVLKELAKVDALMNELKNDKSLPTFTDHFLKCMIFGIAEHVNLKKMYPKQYMKIGKFLAEHDRKIKQGR
jgi:hypothetical protein